LNDIAPIVELPERTGCFCLYVNTRAFDGELADWQDPFEEKKKARTGIRRLKAMYVWMLRSGL